MQSETSVADPAKNSPRQDLSLAQLANDYGYSLEAVEDLYQQELSLLQRNARIGIYVPLLAMRRVRDVLRDGPQEAEISRN